MVNAQQLFDQKFPSKKSIKELNFFSYLNHDEEGELVIKNFPDLVVVGGPIQMNNPAIYKVSKLTVENCPKLEVLNVSGFWDNKELVLKNLPNLAVLNCAYNRLTNTSFLRVLNAKKLGWLDMRSNNFSSQDLSFCEPFVNLERFYLGTGVDMLLTGKRAEEGIYDHFQGSLKPLRNMKNLLMFGINDTDIDQGLEYLPNSVISVHFRTEYRPEAKVKVFQIVCGEGWGEVERIKRLKVSGDLKKEQEIARQKYLTDKQEKEVKRRELEEIKKQLIAHQAKLSIQIEKDKILNQIDENLKKENENLVRQNKKLEEQLNKIKQNSQLSEDYSFYKKFFHNYLTSQKKKLQEWKDKLNEEEQEWWEILLEAQEESKQSSFAQKQIERAKSKLNKNLGEQELVEHLARFQQIKNWEEQVEKLNKSNLEVAQVEIPPKQVSN